VGEPVGLGWQLPSGPWTPAVATDAETPASTYLVTPFAVTTPKPGKKLAFSVTIPHHHFKVLVLN
jgi:hypothetical protein